MTSHSNPSRFFGEDIHYPESDGRPMADNTIQAEWIINLYNNLHILLKDVLRVFIAADHFWYPVEGRPDIRKAPDVMVAFDRPRAHRRSYRQWKEDGIPLHVVFEVMSPSNTYEEMNEKKTFYEQYGTEEFIIIDPEANSFIIYLRHENKLEEVKVKGNQWTSPRLGMKLLNTSDGIKALYPNGEPFKTAEELQAEAMYYKHEAEKQKLEIDRLKEELRKLKGE